MSNSRLSEKDLLPTQLPLKRAVAIYLRRLFIFIGVVGIVLLLFFLYVGIIPSLILIAILFVLLMSLVAYFSTILIYYFFEYKQTIENMQKLLYEQKELIKKYGKDAENTPSYVENELQIIGLYKLLFRKFRIISRLDELVRSIIPTTFFEERHHSVQEEGGKKS